MFYNTNKFIFRLFHSLIAHATVAAIAAVVLCWQTAIWLNLKIAFTVYGFVFSATFASYNLHSFIASTQFAPLASWPKRVLISSHAKLGVIASFIAVYLLYLQPIATSLLIPAIVFTGLYSLPLTPFVSLQQHKLLGLLKTGLLAFTWTWVTLVLPLKQLDVEIFPFYYFGLRFLFMLILCILFDQRDIAVDEVRGLHSIATLISSKNLQVFLWLVWIVFSVLLLQITNSIEGKIIQFFICSVLLYLIIVPKNNKGFWFYYVVVDGMMILFGCSTALTSI
ncbi:MAG: hypothetical protein RLY16_853 [Bacteroidota bacterium]